MSGSEVTLYGRNLQNIDSASLGNVDITLLAHSETSVSVDLPDIPQSNILRLSANSIVSNPLVLDIRHDVRLSKDLECRDQAHDKIE